ncbi:MAG: hypothetical protein WCA12_16650 [Burkholderiales bacterium]
MNYPLRHISIRVPWHDTGWDGRVCAAPRLNASCLKLKRIAEDRDDAAEEAVAGKRLDELPQAQWPACAAERMGFMAPFEYVRMADHPLIARDLVEHFENRLSAMDGKAMVVCMSRRICADVYRELVKLRPGWGSDEDESGVLKVVMTGSASDPLDWQPHVRNKPRREALANRFRAPKDPFRLVLVRDMWLTGFDAPSLHTMYIDKPMRRHGLMQAIARVNRVFKDKPGGLVVDYLGLAQELKQALAT